MYIVKKMQCKSEKRYIKELIREFNPVSKINLPSVLFPKHQTRKQKNDQVLNEIKYLILVNPRKKQKRASYVTVK